MKTLPIGTTIDPIGEQIMGGFAQVRDQVSTEGRALSAVTRTVHYGNDSCILCRTNTDPKAVPLHPNCTCNIATEDVQLGQTSSDHPFFRTLSTATEEVVFLSESDLPVAILLDPATTGVIAIDELRFGDLARWLEQIQPALQGADNMLTILEQSDEDVADLAEVASAVAEGSEAAEAISRKRIWFGISKVVAGL